MELYNKFYRELTGYCKKLSQGMAEDLVQETFLRALTHQEELLDLSAAQQRAWLYRTARNLAIDQARKSVWQTCVEEETLEQTEFETDFSTVAVHQMLAKLPPLERVAFEFRYFRGYNATELGHMMGVSPSTIRARLASARKHLREQLVN